MLIDAAVATHKPDAPPVYTSGHRRQATKWIAAVLGGDSNDQHFIPVISHGQPVCIGSGAVCLSNNESASNEQEHGTQHLPTKAHAHRRARAPSKVVTVRGESVNQLGAFVFTARRRR
jgi:hypothetical protein